MKKQINLRVDESWIPKIQELAARDGRSVNNFLEMAVHRPVLFMEAQQSQPQGRHVINGVTYFEVDGTEG